MIKFWARTVTDGKMRAQTVFEREGNIKWGEMHDYLVAICYELDIPTPVLFKAHIFNMAKFNFTKFKKSDFVEKVDFDYLLVENLSSD